MRRAPALALVGSVVSQADKTLLRQALRIQACCLLLDAAERMGHDDGRICLGLIEPGRLEDIRDDIGPQVSGLVADTFDRDSLLVGITNHRRLFHRPRSPGLSRRITESQQFSAYDGSAGNRDHCCTDEPAPPFINNLITFVFHNLRLNAGAGTSRPHFRSCGYSRRGRDVPAS